MALPSLSRIPAPPDPILGLAEAFRNDPRPGKINLSSGVFVDETGTTPVLPTVTEAERRILAKGATKLYRPIDGDAAYRDAVRAYVFGEGHELATSAPGRGQPDARRHRRAARRGRLPPPGRGRRRRSG